LFITGADIASYLNQPKAAAEAHGRAGDLLVAQGLIEDAVRCYNTVLADDRIGEGSRLPFRLRLAHAERLRGRLDTAEAAYRAIIKQPVPVGDLQDWARLWLGDLILQRGDQEAAKAVWKKDEYKSLPDRIMYRLWSQGQPLPVDVKKPYAAEVAYFNARLAQMGGQSDNYRTSLEQVVKIGAPGDWPVLVANRLLEQSVYAMPPIAQPDDEPFLAPTGDTVP
jgi:tetratricopeptide (TPR) repeat protein